MFRPSCGLASGRGRPFGRAPAHQPKRSRRRQASNGIQLGSGADRRRGVQRAGRGHQQRYPAGGWVPTLPASYPSPPLAPPRLVPVPDCCAQPERALLCPAGALPRQAVSAKAGGADVGPRAELPAGDRHRLAIATGGLRSAAPMGRHRRVPGQPLPARRERAADRDPPAESGPDAGQLAGNRWRDRPPIGSGLWPHASGPCDI